MFVKHVDILDRLLSKDHIQFKLRMYTRLFVCSDKHTNSTGFATEQALYS